MVVATRGRRYKKYLKVLKVLMENKHEKDKVMSNLRQLKGTEMEFGKISVTEDHTIEERQEIKTWVEKAKAKPKKAVIPKTFGGYEARQNTDCAW